MWPLPLFWFHSDEESLMGRLPLFWFHSDEEFLMYLRPGSGLASTNWRKARKKSARIVFILTKWEVAKYCLKESPLKLFKKEGWKTQTIRLFPMWITYPRVWTGHKLQQVNLPITKRGPIPLRKLNIDPAFEMRMSLKLDDLLKALKVDFLIWVLDSSPSTTIVQTSPGHSYVSCRAGSRGKVCVDGGIWPVIHRPCYCWDFFILHLENLPWQSFLIIKYDI